ncbi:hypothetical protein F4560_001160 [Saccharothrix ecbatanensis]|uniref:Uncharacterized protein n=1 Tax=Saccharothrix ecbatanensis TaxID=1105145 RepID=A0A7W9HFN6_9PSEU|nr:hypothetical protein [Saccharothrix ecbatanensis]MBB5801392.1 hypothetical protein [Saccharothrix ecbatanensis]
MFRMMRRRTLVGVVAVVLGLASLGAYLLWPAPTLDAADIDAALPTERDLPGFVAHDGLTGSLSVPSSNKDGRSVLTGAALDDQCRKWREEGDGWACEHVHGVGMVVLELSENVFFRVLSNVLAYDDENAAEVGWNGLVTDIRDRLEEEGIPKVKEGSPGWGDASLSFEVPGSTAMAIRVGTVVVAATVWDGSDQVSENEERDMVQRWPALQISKIEQLVG